MRGMTTISFDKVSSEGAKRTHGPLGHPRYPLPATFGWPKDSCRVLSLSESLEDYMLQATGSSQWEYYTVSSEEGEAPGIAMVSDYEVAISVPSPSMWPEAESAAARALDSSLRYESLGLLGGRVWRFYSRSNETA